MIGALASLACRCGSLVICFAPLRSITLIPRIRRQVCRIPCPVQLRALIKARNDLHSCVLRICENGHVEWYLFLYGKRTPRDGMWMKMVYTPRVFSTQRTPEDDRLLLINVHKWEFQLTDDRPCSSVTNTTIDFKILRPVQRSFCSTVFSDGVLMPMHEF